MTMNSAREKLLQLIRKHAIETAAPGTFFVAKGGSKTLEYINIKSASMCSAIQMLLASQLYESLAPLEPIDAIAGVVLGGCHPASITSSYAWSKSRKLDILYVRKDPKDHGGGSSPFIEGPYRKGTRVVLIDDIVSAGMTASRAADRLREVGCDVRGILAIIDKRRDRTEALHGTKFQALFTTDELLYHGMDMKTGLPLDPTSIH